MTTLNKSARDVMVQYRVHACTDVTGFSFLGHASEMATGSDVQLEIDTAAIDLIGEALDFARMGILPAGMYRNRTFAEPMVDAGDTELAVQDVLYDRRRRAACSRLRPGGRGRAVCRPETGSPQRAARRHGAALHGRRKNLSEMRLFE